MDLHTQIDYYNKLWGEEAFANPWQLERCIAVLRALDSFELANPRICDLGSGTGWLTEILGLFGPTIGVELSDVAVRRAIQRYHNADFVCANIFEWSYPGNSFDVVVSQEVIEHFEDQQRYLGVAHSLLREGGYIILTTPNARTVLAARREERSRQPVENWLSRSELHRLMAEFFTDVRIRSIILGLGSAGIYRFVNSRRLRNTLRAVGLERIWKAAVLWADYGLHFVAIGRKQP